MRKSVLSSRLFADIAGVAVRLMLALVFAYSAWHKIEDPISFMIKVSEYEILPPAWEETFAFTLPWAQMVCAGFLLAGALSRAAAFVSASMLLSFVIAIGVNIYRDRVLGCGCFSEEGNQIGWTLVLFDLFLFAASGWLMVKGGGRLGVDGLFWRLMGKRQKGASEPCADIPDE